MPVQSTAKPKLYVVKRNIRYKNPDKKLGLYRKLITPDSDEGQNGLAFPHLKPEEIKLLERRGFIEDKAISDRRKKAAEAAAEKKAAEAAAQKK